MELDEIILMKYLSALRERPHLYFVKLIKLRGKYTINTINMSDQMEESVLF